MNEYCRNCVWARSAGGSTYYCNNHKKYVKEFDTCRDFKWASQSSASNLQIQSVWEQGQVKQPPIIDSTIEVRLF